MPFKSKAQQGAAFGGFLGPQMQKAAPQWAAETPNIKNLPKHVKGGKGKKPVGKGSPLNKFKAK